MTIQKRSQVGCKDCCVPPCNILLSGSTNYLSAWTELAGTWSTGLSGSQYYWETTSGLAAIGTTTGPDSGRPFKTRGKFKFTTGGSGTATWRLAGGASDISNYLYAEVRFSLAAFYYLQLSLGQVVAGVDTTLGYTPYNSLQDQLNFATFYECFLYLDWDNEGALTCSVVLLNNAGQEGRFYTITKRSVTPAGTYGGFYVTSNTGLLRMSDYLLEHGYSASGTVLCNRTVESCTKGIPGSITVRLADSTPPSVGHCSVPGITHCGLPYDCGGLSGDYVVPFDGDGDDSCNWETALFLIDSQTCGSTYDIYAFIRVTSQYIFTDSTMTTRRITVTVYATGIVPAETCILSRFILDTATSITEFSSFTSIPKDVLTHNCHSANTTCEIQA